jgi:hypothetical protein
LKIIREKDSGDHVDISEGADDYSQDSRYNKALSHSAKWVPKYLNAIQKHERVLGLQDILDQFWRKPMGFLAVS